MDIKQYISTHQEKFSNLIAEKDDYAELMFAYLRATTETLVMAIGPETPKQPSTRRPRGPNKKKSSSPPSGGSPDDEL